MSFCEINNVNVVSNSSAIVGVVIISKNLQNLQFSDSNLRDEGLKRKWLKVNWSLLPDLCLTIKLFGWPAGSSPILPLSWAPTGLKYRNEMTAQRYSNNNENRDIKQLEQFLCTWSDAHKSFSISSVKYLLFPYGFVQFPVGWSSVIGSFCGSP